MLQMLRLDFKLNLLLISAAFIFMLPCQTADGQQDYDEYLQQQNKEYNDFEQQQAEEFERYVQEVTQKWNEFKNSTKRDWYEYSGDLNTLSKVDFEAGEITIETIVPKDDEDVLEQAKENIAEQVKNLLSTDSLTGQNVLEDQLELSPGQKVNKSNTNKFIKEKILPSAAVVKETVKSKDGVERVKIKATFRMVPNHLKIRAEKFLPLVKKYSKQYKLEVSLVMAVMQTESYFNPRAKSHAPAYGLMQLVPKSGGREAYKHAFKKDKIVRPSYLYKPDNNIILGCAYLAKLRDNEFKGITDSDKCRFCMIASYNTGPGNLSRAITGNRNIYAAIDKINAMDDDRLFSKLKRDLPYAETRDYLVKVETRRENYLAWE